VSRRTTGTFCVPRTISGWQGRREWVISTHLRAKSRFSRVLGVEQAEIEQNASLDGQVFAVECPDFNAKSPQRRLIRQDVFHAIQAAKSVQRACNDVERPRCPSGQTALQHYQRLSSESQRFMEPSGSNPGDPSRPRQGGASTLSHYKARISRWRALRNGPQRKHALQRFALSRGWEIIGEVLRSLISLDLYFLNCLKFCCRCRRIGVRGGKSFFITGV